MSPREREVIDGIFERLRSIEKEPRDPDVERYIAERVAGQPYATYALAQAAYVQEEAVKQLNSRVQDLEEQLRAAGSAPASRGSFLDPPGGRGEPARTSVPSSGGGWNTGGALPQGGYPQQGGPWQGGPQQPGPWQGGPPQQGMPPQQGGGGLFGGGGGGFLSGALGAAAGLAGGALLYQGMKGMFGGHGHDSDRHGSFLSSDSEGTARPFGDPDHFRNAMREEGIDPSAPNVDQAADFDGGESDVG